MNLCRGLHSCLAFCDECFFFPRDISLYTLALIFEVVVFMLRYYLHNNSIPSIWN